MWPYHFCFPPPSHKYTHLWQPPLNESTDQTNILPISLSIMVPEFFTCDMHSKIASQTSLLLLGANDSPWFSLFRSVIHAAHREGERDTTDWREWYLFFFFFFKQYFLWIQSFMFLFLIAFLQIVLQTILSFVMTCYGIVHIAGEFKDMDASSELKNK